MSAKYILAHDLGTTGNKASLYDQSGVVLASSFYGYGVEYPHVNWVEQNPQDWWQAVCMSTQQLLQNARVSKKDIACIAFSGQMMGCVALDEQANPLRNAIIWADMRGGAEAQFLIDRFGADEAYRVTGHRASASYSGAKILWIRNHEPDIFARAHKFVHAKDFIVAQLTGNFVTDLSDASGMNLYDLQAKDWSDAILDAIQLDRSVLPELHQSADIVGYVRESIAGEVGLAAGTPVVIGGGDGCCAAAGAGVVREGSAYNYIGSSSWIGIATKEPIFDPTQRTFTWAHLVPDMFSPTGTMQAAGGSYQWLRDVFCDIEKEASQTLKVSPYELMNLQAAQSPPGAHDLLFLPYLLGERSPRWNPDARGAYFGLTVKHNRSDMIRATLEGITLNLCVILRAFEEQGAKIEAMRVIGGGAKGSVWRQIMADIYDMPILRPSLLDEATSLGAAIAGGVAVGFFPDYSIAEQLTPIVNVTQPRSEYRGKYEKLYTLFNRLYDVLEPVYGELAQIDQA
jgi:xylulokinase